MYMVDKLFVNICVLLKLCVYVGFFSGFGFFFSVLVKFLLNLMVMIGVGYVVSVSVVVMMMVWVIMMFVGVFMVVVVCDWCVGVVWGDDLVLCDCCYFWCCEWGVFGWVIGRDGENIRCYEWWERMLWCVWKDVVCEMNGFNVICDVDVVGGWVFCELMFLLRRRGRVWSSRFERRRGRLRRFFCKWFFVIVCCWIFWVLDCWCGWYIRWWCFCRCDWMWVFCGRGCERRRRFIRGVCSLCSRVRWVLCLSLDWLLGCFCCEMKLLVWWFFLIF